MTDQAPSIKAADLRRIGVSKPYAHQLTSGARSPSLALALKIEAALGIPPTAWPLSRRATNDPTPSDQTRAA